MDKFILQAFKNLPEADIPDSLHSAVLRAVIFRRVWNYVSVLTFIISLTFLFSLWHMYTRVLEVDTIPALKAVASTLEFNISSITDSISTLFEFLPIQSIMLSMLNFLALIFMVFLLRSFMRLGNEFVA